LCEDGLNADLAQALGLPVLLVAADRPGCINQVLLTVEALENRKLSTAGVLLNQHEITAGEDSHMNNAEDLSRRLSCPIWVATDAQAALPQPLLERLLQS